MVSRVVPADRVEVDSAEVDPEEADSVVVQRAAWRVKMTEGC